MGGSVGGGPSGASNRRRGRRTHGGGSAGAPMAEINVTPFVDVVMVLLIIFMVSAQLIPAPPAPAPEVFAEIEGVEEIEAAPHIVVEENGDVVVGGAIMSVEEAAAALAGAIEDPTRDLVIIQSLGGADHGAVLGVVRALAEAGYEQVGLAREPGAP